MFDNVLRISVQTAGRAGLRSRPVGSGILKCGLLDVAFTPPQEKQNRRQAKEETERRWSVNNSHRDQPNCISVYIDVDYLDAPVWFVCCA